MQSDHDDSVIALDFGELVRLLDAQDGPGVRRFYDAMSEAQMPRLVAWLDHDQRARLLLLLEPERAAGLLEHVPDVLSAEILSEMAPEAAAEIVAALPSNDRADVLIDMEEEEARAILESMVPEAAAQAQQLARYPERSAGGLMIKEYLRFPETFTIGELLDDMRANTERYQRHDVQYIYVTTGDDVLLGVLRLRDLVLTSPDVSVRQIMVPQAASVRVDATLEELEDFFSTRPYRGVPVVDAKDRLVGVVRHAAVAEAAGEREASDHLKVQGIVGGEELRTMPTLLRAWRRLSWLSINIVLNIVAASVIAIYQDTLSAVIVLAVFLPIISDMSGCSGNQAIAVSMRELSLGLIAPADALRVWGKELAVGLINALALGVLIGAAAFLWQRDWLLSVVVGAALAVNTVLAVSLGGLVPLALRGMRMDPALASGPILTTVTDMCGFFLVLSLASTLLI